MNHNVYLNNKIKTNMCVLMYCDHAIPQWVATMPKHQIIDKNLRLFRLIVPECQFKNYTNAEHTTKKNCTCRMQITLTTMLKTLLSRQRKQTKKERTEDPDDLPN